MRKLIILLVLLLCVHCSANEYSTNYNLEIPTEAARDWISIFSADIVSIDTVMATLSSDSTGYFLSDGTRAMTGALETEHGSILADENVSNVLTLGGVGGATNNENITFDFETVSNQVGFGSSSGATTFLATINFQTTDGYRFKFGSASDAGLLWSNVGNDNLQLGLAVGAAADSGYFSIMEYADLNDVDRSPGSTSANPVQRWYSSDATVSTDYGEVYHNQTDFVIDVGSTGKISLDATLILSTDNVTTIGGQVGRIAFISGDSGVIAYIPIYSGS